MNCLRFRHTVHVFHRTETCNSTVCTQRVEMGGSRKNKELSFVWKEFLFWRRTEERAAGRQQGLYFDFPVWYLWFPPPPFFLKRAVHQLPFTHLKGDSYWLPTVGEEWRREREKPRQWKERDRETRRYRGSFCCWRKSRVTMKQKMGPAATSLALLCLCSLGVCVPMGTGSAAPAQVRTSYAVCALSIRGCSHCRVFS